MTQPAFVFGLSPLRLITFRQIYKTEVDLGGARHFSYDFYLFFDNFTIAAYHQQDFRKVLFLIYNP